MYVHIYVFFSHHPAQSMHDIAIILFETPPISEIILTPIIPRPFKQPPTSGHVFHYNSKNIRHSTPVDILGLQECSSEYHTNPNTQICASASSSDIYKGTSGSPLLCNFDDIFETLCGIVSYGPEIQGSSKPVVYTNLTSYWNWLNSTSYDVSSNNGFHFSIYNSVLTVVPLILVCLFICTCANVGFFRQCHHKVSLIIGYRNALSIPNLDLQKLNDDMQCNGINA